MIKPHERKVLKRIWAYLPVLLFVLVLAVAAVSILTSIKRNSKPLDTRPTIAASGRNEDPNTLPAVLNRVINRDRSKDTILAQNNGSGPGDDPGTNVCDKFGVNLLVGPQLPKEYGWLEEEGLGYYLHALSGNPGEAGPMAEAISGNSQTAVVRFCNADKENGDPDPSCQLAVGSGKSSCNSGEQAADIIINIASSAQTPFVASPVNEPTAETWAGTIPQLARFYECFSNRIRRSSAADLVTIAGPTFNVRHSDGFNSFKNNFESFTDAGGAQYVDIWTFNFYDAAPGQGDFNIPNTITDVLEKVVTDDKPWGINETGHFNGDYATLAEHVKFLAEYEKVSYALFFNAFANDTEDPPRWPGLVIRDDSQNHFEEVFAQVDECRVTKTPLPVSEEPQLVDPETAEYLRIPPHWTMQSCEVRQKDSNGVRSPKGAMAIGLDLNPCTDQENDPTKYDPALLPYSYRCENSENWTAGYAYTGGMRKFPLVEYLASADPTNDNPYTTPCRTLSFRNITDNSLYKSASGATVPFKLYFTSEFPGLARMIRSADETTFNVKTALLGGASGCGILNWNEVIPDPLDEELIYRLHPLNTQPIKHSGGPEVSARRNDTLLGRIFNLISELFQKASNIVNEEKQGGNTFCPAIPGSEGSVFDRYNSSDTRDLNFVDDNPAGPYEYLIEAPYNYELTKTEVCDAQFIGPFTDKNGVEVQGVTGAECIINGINPTGGSNTLVEGGNAEGQFVFRDPVTFECPTVTVCGAPTTCETTHQQIYRNCRNQGKKVDKVGGDPFLRWTRGGYDKTDLIGMSRALYNAWSMERINSPYKIIHRVNPGIRTEWGIRVYDLQYPEVSPKRRSDDGGRILSEELGAQAAEYNLRLEQFPGTDFDPNILPINSSIAEKIAYLDPPVNYQPIHFGGYNTAITESGGKKTGVSKVDMWYYYPWMGQIPRMWERTSVFLQESRNVSTGEPYSEGCLKDSPNVPQELKNLEIDFCDEECGCAGDQDICDCFARDPNMIDPLEDWLFAERTSDPLTSGGGFATPYAPGMCVERPPGTEPTPTPPPIEPSDCDFPLDNVKFGFARPVDGGSNNNSGAHAGTDIVISAGTPVYSIGAGQVVFVRQEEIVNWDKDKGTKDDYNFWSEAYGVVIGIKHNDAVSVYAHLISGSPTVKPGDCVRRNQQIGKIDSTGNSTGPHLHFEARKLHCTRYIQECVINNNLPDDHFLYVDSLSTPREPADDPISITPGGGQPSDTSGLPYCDSADFDDFNDDPGYQGTPRPGKIKCIVKTAAESVGVHPAVLFAIGEKETHWDCSPTWDIWNTGSRTECTGDPRQTAFASRNRFAWDRRLAGGDCTVDVRGITQFSAAGGPSNGVAPDGNAGCADTFNGVVNSNTELMEQCVSALGVELRELTSDDAPFYDEFTDDSRFSRHRVGDAACATAIYVRSYAAERNNGVPLTMDEWTDINLYEGDSENLGLAGNIFWNFSTRYHGSCSGRWIDYCIKANRYAFDAIKEDFFSGLSCDFDGSSGTTPGGDSVDNGDLVCAVNDACTAPQCSDESEVTVTLDSVTQASQPREYVCNYTFSGTAGNTNSIKILRRFDNDVSCDSTEVIDGYDDSMSLAAAELLCNPFTF